MKVLNKLSISGLALAVALSGAIGACPTNALGIGSNSSTTASALSTDDMNLETIIEDADTPETDNLTTGERQANSLAMLNYLTVLSQDVNSSKGSRLKLEELYDDLFNNTRPDTIDRATLDQLIEISDTIESYRMVDVKYERLEYLYEQKRAAAVRNAIPDPVALLSTVRARSIPQILGSMAYMAVDSYTGYKNALADASHEYLTEGWELEDEQSATLHNQRKSTFIYMVEMVNDYNLPGDLALSEASVEKLVSWKNNSNVVGRIQFLESNADTYRAYGGYWLLLAKSYYEQGDYQKCLDAVSEYESMRTGILRKDHDYASVLPLAVAAASETMSDRDYVSYAEKRAAEMVSNTEDSEWELRYLAAQVYIDLYSNTSDTSYLENAYKIELNNVNELANEQRTMNGEYTAAFVEAKVQNNATKAQKNEIKNYNKKAKAEHDVALPPVYQPLLINCDMLFALADKLNVSEASRARIEGVLHPNGEALFLTEPLDERYRMASGTEMSDDTEAGEAKLAFDATKITLPASLVSTDSVIQVTVGKSGMAVPGEWTVKKVKRGNASDVSTYETTFENKSAKGSYSDGDLVTITITDGTGDDAIVNTYEFKTIVEERPWIAPDAITFERV